MDPIVAIQFYLDKMVNDINIDGMKALILDNETTKIISMVYSQSIILEKQIFLVELLGSIHEKMGHLKAIIFIRPTLNNLELLINEIKNPKYGEYHIFFTNFVPISNNSNVSNTLFVDYLDKLAQIDEHSMIKQIQEYYADYLAINHDLYHLNINNSIQLSYHPTNQILQNPIFIRTIDGILSLLLSLKKKPIIRYPIHSLTCKYLAEEVNKRIQNESMFEFRTNINHSLPILLILDRKDDPVTPLLNQWCYQGMVHELLGLFDNRVDLSKTNNPSTLRSDMKEFVLSVLSDTFFEKHKHSNFGDLGNAIKELVENYQNKAQTHENINTIEDMQKFVENYPAFRSQSLHTSKHVTIMGELAKIMEINHLMEISQLEQELAASNNNDDHTNHIKDLIDKLNNNTISSNNKIKLILLYSLRYEINPNNQIQYIKTLIPSMKPNNIYNNNNNNESIHISIDETNNNNNNNNSSYIDTLLKNIIEYAGNKKRIPDYLYDNSKLKKYMKSLTQGFLQGAPNVYSQHVPPLINVIENILKNALNEKNYPTIIPNGINYSNNSITNTNNLNLNINMNNDNNNNNKIKEIIIFITGGVTFEEAEKISELNKKLAITNQKILLGGSFIHNSSTFLQEIENLTNITNDISYNKNKNNINNSIFMDVNNKSKDITSF